MTLTQFETETALWKKIEAELTTRLETLRIQNDGDRTLEETAKIRGRIAEVKTILDWAAPILPMQTD